MTATNRLSRNDWLSAAVLWAATLVIFSAGASRLGFYYDDGGWLASLPSASPSDLWALALGYMPGRNLHVVWQYLIYKIIPDPASHLPALHLLQSTLDGLAVAGFFLLLRLGYISCQVALLVAALFDFWPTHGETHYWLTAAPQHLVSTLLVLLFVWTSFGLTRRNARAWFWLIDALAFLGALFTYDQVVFVLWSLVLVRVVLRPKWVFAGLHLPYMAATVFYAWLKLPLAPAEAPALSGDSWRLLHVNVASTISYTAGPLWLRHVGPLFERITPGDWVLALLVSAAVTYVALWLLRAPPSRPLAPVLGRPIILLIAALFYIASYLPVWLWHISPRHHYLPSVGLFAGGAVCLAWLLERVPARPFQLLMIWVAGSAIFLLAAASRGESRYWEDSFTAKKRLFTELQPDLRDKEVLALENFPIYLGPAYFFSPHDAAYGPGLLYRRPNSPVVGDVSSAPAPGGIFLRTFTYFHGFENFRYYPTSRWLVARFTRWENGTLRWEKDPARPLPYQVLSSEATPRPRPFAVHGAAARREGDDAVIRLEVTADLPPESHLAALLSVFHNGEFHRWGYFEKGRGLNIIPVLLGEPGLKTLRLYSFPKTERIRLEFYAAFSDRSPVRLGECEAAVQS